jgi:hypothetical protein
MYTKISVILLMAMGPPTHPTRSTECWLQKFKKVLEVSVIYRRLHKLTVGKQSIILKCIFCLSERSPSPSFQHDVELSVAVSPPDVKVVELLRRRRRMWTQLLLAAILQRRVRVHHLVRKSPTRPGPNVIKLFTFVIYEPSQ